ncbi:LacI family DNA-binding transcriptional regulator [Actinoplanes sp. LDG1-06]|uniref:LacI family DNA-binding transcriptional regulator n=1 Tax=Paractinoplanes ovalisporus TaxID=2810368 RepID=A0ABS2AEP8_9ACTN|nr:LacI family DNA-binding transcriptional regulator [Actinoplanes ovalisporus]MBM2618245.1 LacI family DNA-binding transcriptional regulator [Actinoplanes ovalisporus]
MQHPYRISEIAAQAGLSQATVDRVLHARGGVRPGTVRDVHQAIAALDRRRQQQSEDVPLPARVVPIDLVVEDRDRVEAALRAELGGLRPAVIRPRFHSAADPVAALGRVARSRSQGLVVQARETPELVEAVGRLEIPVVTLGTDLPASKRVAHVGLDESEAGATAAYLVEQWLADRAGVVLVVGGARSDQAAVVGGARSDQAAVEGGAKSERAAAAGSGAKSERIAGFEAELRRRAPNRRVLMVEAGSVRRELAMNPSVRAVYDPGGGTAAAVVEAFAAERRNYDVFVAHELDDDNADLLRAGRLSAVLHHDLRADLRQACVAVLQALGALPGPVRSAPASVQVITPLNIPGN